MTGIAETFILMQERHPGIPDKSDPQDAKLRKACADFESIFIHYILKSARKTLPENGIFGNSHESKIYKSMMDEQLARSVTKGSGLGLAELLFNELQTGDGKTSPAVTEFI